MQCILLAAGIGSRLGPLTEDLPKSMLPLGDKHIIDYVLDTLSLFPFEEILIVGGFAFEKLNDYLAGRDKRIRLINNDKYLLGSIVTLQRALPSIEDEFFLFNADHIYPAAIVPRLLQGRRGITAACDFDRPLTDDDMKIRGQAGEPLTAISKKLKKYDGGYIGITYCSEESLATYRTAAETVLAASEGKGVVEDVLAHLISIDKAPSICDMSGIRWYEVDTQEDLEQAQAAITIK